MNQRYSKHLRRFSFPLAAALMMLFSLPGKLYAQMPPNLDFAFGNFNNWKCWVGISQTGTATTGAAFGSGTVSAPIGGNAPGPGSTNRSRHAITSGTATDYYGRFPIVSSTGGLFAMRIGNDSFSARADRIQYFVHVPTGTLSYNLQCQYAAVLQDGAHAPSMQSTFQVIAYDSATGAVVPAANNLYIAKWAIPGFSPFVHPVTSVVDSAIAWLPWTATTINLSGMAGRTITIECTALDCTAGGHWAYGYFDVISAEQSLIPQLMAYNAAGDSVLLKSPPGYKTYHWYNQNFSQSLNAPTDTTRTKWLPAPTTSQYYNLIITPYSSIGVADTIASTILQQHVGVSSAPWATMSIYPNPATTSLNISFPSPFEGTVSLINVAGASVYTKHISSSTSYVVPTAGFAAGIYTLVLTDNGGASVVKKVAIKQ